MAAAQIPLFTQLRSQALLLLSSWFPPWTCGLTCSSLQLSQAQSCAHTFPLVPLLPSWSCPLPSLSAPLPISVVLALPLLFPVLLPLHHPRIQLAPFVRSLGHKRSPFFLLPPGHQPMLPPELCWDHFPPIPVPLGLGSFHLCLSHIKSPSTAQVATFPVPQCPGSSALPLPKHPLSSPVHSLPGWDRTP